MARLKLTILTGLLVGIYAYDFTLLGKYRNAANNYANFLFVTA
jgi:hypothetical protein